MIENKIKKPILQEIKNIPIIEKASLYHKLIAAIFKKNNNLEISHTQSYKYIPL